MAVGPNCPNPNTVTIHILRTVICVRMTAESARLKNYHEVKSIRVTCLIRRPIITETNNLHF